MQTPIASSSLVCYSGWSFCSC